MTNLLHNDFQNKEETFAIIGAAMDVHKQLGFGFLEAVYQEALAIELTIRGIPFVQERSINITYKQHQLSKYYIADFLCFENIIIEIKALSELTNTHEAQVLNYLKATGLKVALLINFGEKSLKYKRIANNNYF